MPPLPSPRPAERTSLRRHAYAALRDAIVDGTLEPGERLRDTELERWLGVSRTPIREALLDLQRAGLVVSTPGRSTTVSPIENDATRSAAELARALHRLAAECAAGRVGADHLHRMRQANERFAHALAQDDIDGALHADDEFHGILVEASGNVLLPQLLEQVTPLLRRVERLRFASAAARSSVHQHDEILARLAEGDATGAGAASAANWAALAGHVDDPAPAPTAQAGH